MLNNQERMDTSEITEEKSHTISNSEDTTLFVNHFNEQINELILDYGSINPSTLNTLNKELAGYEFSQKEIKEIVPQLNLDPHTRKAVEVEQLRLAKFHSLVESKPELYRGDWNRNGKRRHDSSPEERPLNERSLDEIKKMKSYESNTHLSNREPKKSYLER